MPPPSGHPSARSAEPGEDWSWCYVDEVAFVVRSCPGCVGYSGTCTGSVRP